MNVKDYNKFWQRIHKSAKDKGFPLRVMFELTYKCNFSCRHCYVPFSFREKSKKEELKTKEVFSILDQLRDIGCFYLGFTGGEPFVRKDIMDILWYAKRCGFKVIIYTNGSLIDENVADELARLAPNKVDITIPAMTESAFEQITGVSGYRDKVFKAIDLLHKRGVALGFKTCVLKENESQIKDIQNFASRLGSLHRLDNMLSHCLDGSKEPYKYKVSSYLGRTQEVNKCDSTEITSKPNSKLKQNNSLFRCSVGKSQVAITPFAEMKMCLFINYPRYKILEFSFEDCWQRLKNVVKDIKPDQNYKCGNCDLKVFCDWCPARSWLEFGNFTSCEPICRASAKNIEEKTTPYFVTQ